MSITIPWWIFLLDVLGIIFAFFIGWKTAKKCVTYGTIRIETNNDGSREAVRFIIDYDLDWIKTQKQIVFKVEDLSQNSQS